MMIILYTASRRNDGDYLDGGSTVEVGDEPEQIAQARADELLDAGLAEVSPEIPAEDGDDQ